MPTGALPTGAGVRILRWQNGQFRREFHARKLAAHGYRQLMLSRVDSRAIVDATSMMPEAEVRRMELLFEQVRQPASNRSPAPQVIAGTLAGIEPKPPTYYWPWPLLLASSRQPLSLRFDP